ncbi:hypothetical protein [Mesorhizobium sp. M7A.F.Ca.CA.004.02.1.1]|uniref:hypothetical protein n=1 Tax=Mesorhizobium sp. M7A.F.Ca.CA.004.02.1.1 TaxID=2496690 RepID=UPI000FCA70FC|nr:hypothetical protein [Mesorhizobium sp. M7A.F.Ca.CA.004.02.1.1]RVB05673.1 hypothetical protein EN912_02100 [Mesorhizobium sp. M7A.F.Ca.CA.004.02.1.1]
MIPRPTYVIQKLAERTPSGNRWKLFNEYTGGHTVLLGYHVKKAAAIVVARLLAGRGGKIEVRKMKVERITAWKVPA